MATNQCSAGCDDGILDGKDCRVCGGNGLRDPATDKAQVTGTPLEAASPPQYSGSKYDDVR
jgi:hypothetical protein